MKFILKLTVPFFLFPAATSAQLDSADIPGLVQNVERLCADASSDGSILEFEGDAGVGGKLRMLGLGVEGTVTGQQWSNIQSLLDGRADPTICKFEFLEILLPLMDGVDDKHMQSITDTCQSSSGIRVCVKTDEMRRLGSRVFVPISFSDLQNKSQFIIQFLDPAGQIYADTGEEYPQKRPGGAIKALRGQTISHVFSADLSNPSDVESISVKINLTTPLAEIIFFDIFLN